jgi:hypothetical protein
MYGSTGSQQTILNLHYTFISSIKYKFVWDTLTRCSLCLEHFDHVIMSWTLRPYVIYVLEHFNHV